MLKFSIVFDGIKALLGDHITHITTLDSTDEYTYTAFGSRLAVSNVAPSND